MTLFRANVLFRNFEVQGGADRTLIYLTLHVVQCLVKCERIEDKQLALKELRALSIKSFPGPGEAGWTLGGLFPAPSNATEANLWKTYMKQAREELAIRLCDRLFDGPAAKNKWWQVWFAHCVALSSLSRLSSAGIFEAQVYGQGAEGLRSAYEYGT